MCADKTRNDCPIRAHPRNPRLIILVDLNRIPLPADTPIIDERFKDGDKAASPRSGGQHDR
jgi:hypothetical protein